jgi:hypothetical protein
MLHIRTSMMILDNEHPFAMINQGEIARGTRRQYFYSCGAKYLGSFGTHGKVHNQCDVCKSSRSYSCR